MNKQIILVPGGSKALRKAFEEQVYNKHNKDKDKVFIADHTDLSANKKRIAIMLWSTDERYFAVGSDGAPIPNTEGGAWMLAFCDTVDEVLAKIKAVEAKTI